MVSFDPATRIERILNVLLCLFIKNDQGISESDGVAFRSMQDMHDEQLVALEKKALLMLGEIGTEPPFNITEDIIKEKFRKTREKIDQSRQEQKSALSLCHL